RQAHRGGRAAAYRRARRAAQAGQARRRAHPRQRRPGGSAEHQHRGWFAAAGGREMRRAIATGCALLAGLVIAGCSSSGGTQAGGFDPRDFSGTWERYPTPTDAERDPSTVAPSGPVGLAGIPAPPLKPEYKAEWEAERRRHDEANAAGRPIATHYTHCIPDG